jgi:hypothetical protein
MDLETVAKKVKAHKYHNREEFLYDVDLILENSIAYNGEESQFTEKARALGRICRDTLEEVNVIHFGSFQEMLIFPFLFYYVAVRRPPDSIGE